MVGLRLNKRAQSTLEYAVLVSVLVAALIAMQVYIKRGYQGKLREGADSMGEQFSPAHTTYTYTTVSNTVSTENLLEDATTLTTIRNQISERTGNERVDVETEEKWWE